MPGKTLPSDQSSHLSGPGGVIARLERLERRIGARGRGVEAVEQVFSYHNDLENDVESPPWYPRRGGAIKLVRVSLLAPATSDHIIDVRVDGSAAQQFTLPTGELTIVEATNIDLTPISYVTIKTVTVTDADLSAQLVAV